METSLEENHHVDGRVVDSVVAGLTMCERMTQKKGSRVIIFISELDIFPSFPFSVLKLKIFLESRFKEKKKKSSSEP